MYDAKDSVLPLIGQEANAHLPLVFGLAMMQSRTRAEAERPEAVREFLALVRGLIRQIDDAVGRIVAQLDLANTVVFFTSDHGDFSGHRGLMRKNPWLPFDDLARVPFMASGAMIASGRQVDALVQTSDIALTLLDYAGVEPPSDIDFDSRSLRPMLEERATGDDLDRAVYSAISMGWPMARYGQHKLIGNDERPGRVLFDLENDPHRTIQSLP